MLVYPFHQIQEMAVSAPLKDGSSEEGPSKFESSPKETFSPSRSDLTSGEMSCLSWVVDSSGFLSPAGPALKEVLDLVDGVYIYNKPHQHVFKN